MKRGWFLLFIPAVAFLLIGLFISVSARAAVGMGSFTNGTPLPTLTPVPPPTITPPVFTATMYVVADKSLGTIDDTFHVRVSIQVSEGCHYLIYDLTLGQAGDDAPIFKPDTETVGPGVSNPFTFTLRAVSPGTVAFKALAFGERNCGDYWNWAYVGGVSIPVTILQYLPRVYIPVIWRK